MFFSANWLYMLKKLIFRIRLAANLFNLFLFYQTTLTVGASPNNMLAVFVFDFS